MRQGLKDRNLRRKLAQIDEKAVKIPHSEIATFKNESDLQNYIIDHWHTIFNKFTFIGTEVPVNGIYSHKAIGYIDLIFKYRDLYYITEIKNKTAYDFWESLKVVGYTKAFSLEHNYPNCRPLILIRKDILTNDRKCILYNLKIRYITFEWTSEGYLFEYDLSCR